MTVLTLDRTRPQLTATLTRLAPVLLRWVAALAGALVIFSVLIVAKGANPAQVFGDMLNTTFGRSTSIDQIFIRMTPLVLGALAVAVPAKAGLTNVGGEGQIIMGGAGACGVYEIFGDLGTATIPLMIIAGALAGMLWAGIAAALRLLAGVNEAISTLLLNFVALDVLNYLIYQTWRDNPVGQPTTKMLASDAKLPVLWAGTQINIGIVIAVIATVIVALALAFTRWGFKLQVAGGNPEAARRAGFRVPLLVVTALLIGGALAGIAGMTQYAGVEYKLRPGFGDQLGYTAFLACWLARHRPFPILLSTFVFAVLSVSADALQILDNLPAASVHVLTALILIAVLGFTSPWKKATT